MSLFQGLAPLAVDDIQVGDHIFTKSKDGVQHHGIAAEYRNVKGAFHFDKEGIDSEYVLENCVPCRARNNDRINEGRGGQSLRFSCYRCFSFDEPLYRCEYGRALGSVAYRKMGSRSTRTSRPGDEVVKIATALYESVNFGTYRIFTRNCEDFARFCKIGKVGSKQVARGYIGTALVTGMLSTSFAAYSIMRLYQNYRLKPVRRDLAQLAAAQRVLVEQRLAAAQRVLEEQTLEAALGG